MNTVYIYLWQNINKILTPFGDATYQKWMPMHAPSSFASTNISDSQTTVEVDLVVHTYI